MNENSSLAYRSAAADGATYTDMLLLVYDAITKDLLQAGQAAERMQVEARCRHSNHALLLVGHVESWVNLLDDPKLVSSLILFYGMLRTRILQLQQSNSSAEFQDLANFVCEARAAWQRKQQNALNPSAISMPREAISFTPVSTEERSNRSAWSA